MYFCLFRKIEFRSQQPAFGMYFTVNNARILPQYVATIENESKPETALVVWCRRTFDKHVLQTDTDTVIVCGRSQDKY